MRFMAKRARVILSLSIVIALTMSIHRVDAAEITLDFKDGILTYGDKTCDLGAHEFVCPIDDPYWDGWYIPAGTFKSALYSEPAQMGNYIYLIAAIFVAREVDFNDSSEYVNQQVHVGDTWTCIVRFKKDTLKPELMSRTLTYQNWYVPYDTTINEGDKDNMAQPGYMLYPWATGRLIPQMWVSEYDEYKMYTVAEWYNPKVRRQVYQLGYFMKPQLEASKGSNKEVFWVKAGIRDDTAHPGAYWFHEADENTIVMTVFPKDYNGTVYDDYFDISVYGKPKYIRTATWEMTQDDLSTVKALKQEE